jgi:membrane carboxypeptidase/penicillin-binding protein
VVGVWVGFDDGHTLRHSGSGAALPIFADFVVEALSASGRGDFRVPDGVETLLVVAAEGQPAGLRCAGDPEVFLDGTQPWQRCDPWGWFVDQRLYRITDYAGASEAEPRPPVAAARRSGRRRQRTLWHLPEWLNIFRRR